MRSEKVNRVAHVEATAAAASLLQSSIEQLDVRDSILLASDLGGPELGKRLSRDLAALIAAATAHAEWLKNSGLLQVPERTAPERKVRFIAQILKIVEPEGLKFSTGDRSPFRRVCEVVFAAAGLKDLLKPLALASKSRGLKCGRGPANKSKATVTSIPRKWVFDPPET